MARPVKNPPADGGGRFANMKNRNNETMAPGLVGPGKSAITRKGKSAPATKSKTKKGA